MRARAHGLLGAGVWLGLAEGAHVGHEVVPQVASWPPLVTYAGAVLAAGYAIWPDLDCDDATAARSLGWPSRLVGWVIDTFTDHRGGTHRVVTCVLLAAAVYVLTFVPWVGFGVTLLGVAFAQAALTAHLRRKRCDGLLDLLSAALFLRRIGPAARLVVSLALTFGLLYLDPTPTWLAAPVLVGGLAHLLGDMFTRDRFPAFAPFWRREVGGWGIIPPTPRFQRVTWQERLIEVALVAGCAYACLSLAPGSLVA